MPTRQIPPPVEPLLTPPQHHAHHRTPRLLPLLAGGFAAAFFFILLAIWVRKFTRKRTVLSDCRPPHRFSYSVLRRATSSFSTSHRLGRGGIGSVYRGSLGNDDIAVKLIDAGSLQGEREFQNELFFAGKLDSKYILSVKGFSANRRRRHMLLVYELISNGSLQDCLLHRKCAELKEWSKRFSIAIDIAKGLEYLHHYCDPPVIHGDVKPSNILLDFNFHAKIGDFGLARVKSEDQYEVSVKIGGLEKKRELDGTGAQDNGSAIEDKESVTTTGGFDEFNVCLNESPESFVRVTVEDTSLEMTEAAAVSPRRGVMSAMSPASVSDGNFDSVSVGNGTEMVSDSGAKRSQKRSKSPSAKDWWWKQDNGAGESGIVKDYVMEWIGNEIMKERPKSEWIVGASSSSVPIGKPEKSERKMNHKRLDWWTTLDEDKTLKKDKKRLPRQWWKEEFCEELARKKKKNKQRKGSIIFSNNEDTSWTMNEDLYMDRKKKKRSRSSSGPSTKDWWLEGLSGELWRGGRGGYHNDSTNGDIPKSGGVSSTPSMRGTVCYVAPEYGGGGDTSEKCDVYSFGVLLLVLIAGRRPLQVTGSPMSEFQRANLISWARHLARAGKLLDLVDQAIQCLDQEQALLCITIALICLQKSPARRPSMKEVVGMLSGELQSPRLPVEFSPSPPSGCPFKFQKKGR